MAGDKENPNFEEEAAKELEEKEKKSGLEYNKKTDTPKPTNLGIAKSVTDREKRVEEGKKIVDGLGWKAINIEDLPSAGLFYPDDIEVGIRAATVAEIRHFSTIEERDPFDIDDKLNFVIDKCLKIKQGSKILSWKDLKEEDRFYLIFAIRDYTFKVGENKILVNMKCREIGCENSEKIELKNGAFDYYKISGKLMNYYSPEEKCFVIDSKKLGPFKIYIPSLGVTTFIKNFIRKKTQMGEKYDASFVKLGPFLFDDWRTLNDNSYKRVLNDSFTWSPAKFSAILKIVEMIRFGVKLEVKKKCSNCGAEVSAPLSFPNGTRSLFVISDELEDLL